MPIAWVIALLPAAFVRRMAGGAGLRPKRLPER